MSLTLDGELGLSNQVDGEMGVYMNAGGGDKAFVYEQARLSDTWTIQHNLHKYPSVSVVDTAKTLVDGEVEYLSKDVVQIRFNAPFSGYAYLN